MLCIDGCHVVLNLVHEEEASSISSPLQTFPFKLFNHGRDTVWTVIPLEGESCCSNLDGFYLENAFVCMWVPD